MQLSSLSLALTRAGRRASTPVWSPTALFASGEQGAWYDPSDFSTMFQDAPGTTPVTAVGQPVGLLLDKSKGLVLGPELVTNGDFSSTAGWTLTSSAVVSGALNCSSAISLNFAVSSISVVAGKTYQVSFTVTNYVSGGAFLVLGVGGNVSTPTLVGNGVLTARIVAGFGNAEVRIGCPGSGFTGTVDNISVRELPGNHATQATAASRPLLEQDAGGRYYLRFDGVDDWMQTAAFAMTSTSKVDVFSGVTNNQPSSFGLAYTFGANPIVNDGAFGLYTYVSTSGDYSPATRGTVHYFARTAGAAIPRTSVLTANYDVVAAVAQDSVKLRENAAAQSLTMMAGGVPTGTVFGTHSLFIGQRGSSNDARFNGRIYSLIIRGAASTTDQITAAETWVNGKTGAY